MVGAPPLAGLLLTLVGDREGEALGDAIRELDFDGRALIDAEALALLLALLLAHGVVLAVGVAVAVALSAWVGVDWGVGVFEGGCGDWRGVPVASAVAVSLGDAEAVACALEVAVAVGVRLGPLGPDVGEFVHVGASEPDSAEAGSASAVPYTSELTPTDTATAAAARRPRPPADTRFTES